MGANIRLLNPVIVAALPPVVQIGVLF